MKHAQPCYIMSVNSNNSNDNFTNEDEWKNDDFLSFCSDKQNCIKDEINESLENNNEEINNKYQNDILKSGHLKKKGNVFKEKSIFNCEKRETFPPWMNEHSRLRSTRKCLYNYMCDNSDYNFSTPPLVKLHNEIVDFTTLMEPHPDEMKEREKLIEDVKHLVLETFGKDKCRVEVFGSQATGLLLPSSDIDFVVLLDGYNAIDNLKNNGFCSNDHTTNNSDNKDNYKKKSKKNTNDNQNKTKNLEEYNVEKISETSSPYERLGIAFRTKWLDKLSYLEVIENTRIPIVKFTHGLANLSGDISINQPAGPQAADLMKRLLDAMPPLKPLTFVLKYFMAARGLNEPYSGGVGSYMLQLMIVSFLQHREREEFNNCRSSVMNLGSLLLEFFELYGIDFNYVLTGISVRSDGRYFPKGDKERKEHFWQPTRPHSLSLENPLDLSADVGRASFRIQLIQKSFETAFKVLMAYVSEPEVKTVSILEKILPPTEEMTKRATMLKFLRIEENIKVQGYKESFKDNKKEENNPSAPMEKKEGSEHLFKRVLS